MSARADAPDGHPREVELRVDSRLANVKLAGRAIRAMCASAGVPARDCARVELAVVEAMNNACRHAYHGEPGHPIEVRFSATGDGITIEVADHGTPMRTRRAPVLDFDPGDVANLPEGGMGLHLIHSVMDHVEYVSERGRNALVMSRRRAA